MQKLILIIILFSYLSVLGQTAPSIQYLYPKPGSTHLPEKSHLIVRFESCLPAQISNLNTFIKISGSESGNIPGNVKISSDNKTILFYPENVFISGETITVHLNPIINSMQQASIDSIYQFSIKSITDFFNIQNNISSNALNIKNSNYLQPGLTTEYDPIVLNGISIPRDFPWIDVSISDNPDSEYIFLNNWGGIPYNMILDLQGNPVFIWRCWDHCSITDAVNQNLTANYTVFDNGNHHLPPYSRALELQVDLENMTVTKVWEFRDSPDKSTFWMGNVQRLPSGNTLINWSDGSLPKINEVRPDGSIAYEMISGIGLLSRIRPVQA